MRPQRIIDSGSGRSLARLPPSRRSIKNLDRAVITDCDKTIK
jgi:hypothetical protein